MTQAYRDKNEFVILIDGELKTFDKYEDIPEVFDNVIKFLPAFPPEPHTEEQHRELSQWNDKLQKLMERERKNASRLQRWPCRWRCGSLFSTT